MEHPLKLSEDTEKRFNQLERIIEKGITHFVEVGTALMIIRDEKLYKIIFQTFEEYCEQRWGFTKQHAYRLIGSAKTIQNLKSNPGVTLPQTEKQIRPLAKLEPEQQQEVWQKAIKTAPKGKVTARHVEETLKQTIPHDEELEEPEIEDSPVLKQLKRFWALADSYEKETFLNWIKSEERA